MAAWCFWASLNTSFSAFDLSSWQSTRSVPAWTHMDYNTLREFGWFAFSRCCTCWAVNAETPVETTSRKSRSTKFCFGLWTFRGTGAWQFDCFHVQFIHDVWPDRTTELCRTTACAYCLQVQTAAGMLIYRFKWTFSIRCRFLWQNWVNERDNLCEWVRLVNAGVAVHSGHGWAATEGLHTSCQSGSARIAHIRRLPHHLWNISGWLLLDNCC